MRPFSLGSGAVKRRGWGGLTLGKFHGDEESLEVPVGWRHSLDWFGFHIFQGLTQTTTPPHKTSH